MSDEKLNLEGLFDSPLRLEVMMEAMVQPMFSGNTFKPEKASKLLSKLHREGILEIWDVKEATSTVESKENESVTDKGIG